METIYFSETINFDKIDKFGEIWRTIFPSVRILALLPEADKDKVGEVQKIFSQKQIQVAGAVFPELVAGDRFHKHGIMLFAFADPPWWFLFSSMSSDPETLRGRIHEISKIVRLNIEPGIETTLFMFFDAMIPEIATILDELYLNLADRVHYVGINAGSETFQPMSCLFDNNQSIQDGVLMILLKNHPGAILEHGYRAPDKMISATATSGNRIISIDWRPAFEVYQELIKEQTGQVVTKDNFYENAVHHPFGIIRANNEILVRIPVALQDDGSLFCVGEVPTNSVLTLLEAPEIDHVQTVQTLARGLGSVRGFTRNKDILTFYCAGRRLHLGNKSTDELVMLKKETGAERLLGALSLGEIGSSIQGGYPLFHNATLVCSLWEG